MIPDLDPMVTALVESVDNPMQKIVRDYAVDSEYRAQVEMNPRIAFSDRGLDVPENLDVQVHVCTDDTFYVVFPPDPNVDLADESLAMVAGGKSASSVGSAGTASTASTVSTTLGSASSVGSAGTAGSAG